MKWLIVLIIFALLIILFAPIVKNAVRKVEQDLKGRRRGNEKK